MEGTSEEAGHRTVTTRLFHRKEHNRTGPYCIRFHSSMEHDMAKRDFSDIKADRSEDIQRSQFREVIWNTSGGKCWYCGDDLNPFRFHVDHVVPKSKGGTTAIQNLAPSCPSCNMSKNGMGLEDFRMASRWKRSGSPKFTDEQVAYLNEAFGIDVDPGPTPFWFEQEGIEP